MSEYAALFHELASVTRGLDYRLAQDPNWASLEDIGRDIDIESLEKKLENLTSCFQMFLLHKFSQLKLKTPIINNDINISFQNYQFDSGKKETLAYCTFYLGILESTSKYKVNMWLTKEGGLSYDLQPNISFYRDGWMEIWTATLRYCNHLEELVKIINEMLEGE